MVILSNKGDKFKCNETCADCEVLKAAEDMKFLGNLLKIFTLAKGSN